MPRKMAEGKCVKTIVLRGPRRRAMGRATRLEMVAMMLVVKNRVPRYEGGRE